MRKIILFFSVCVFISCSGTKRSGSNDRVIKPNPRTNTNTSKVQKGTGAVDTIRWTEIDRTNEYNDKIENIDLDKRASYSVALFLPFELEGSNVNDANDEDSKLGRFTQYYAGVKLALNTLNDEGINIKVDVYDAESGSFDNKLRSCKNADVIIGPRNTDQLKTTANFGKVNEIPVISPWKSGTKLTKENPYFIQLQTSQKDHYIKIVEHAKSEFDDDQIFILSRKVNKDMRYMNYIQSVGRALNADNSSEKPFNEYFIEEDSLRIGDTAFDSIFYEDKTSVFILPNWSFLDDEEFIYNTVRKMSGEKGLKDVVFYGMPILIESDKIKFEHYRNLRMRIVRSSYVDKSIEESKAFMKKFYENYAGFPTDEAYEGYDAMMFVGRQLNQYGKKFQYFLDQYQGSLLQTEFDVQKIFDQSSGDKFDNIQYFQNRHLYILKFENDKFELDK